MRLRTLLLSGLAFAFGVQEARAQSAAPAAAPSLAAAPTSEWQFAISPYIWIAGLSGELRTPRADIGGGTVTSRFSSDLASNLSGFAFMGAAEARYGRFSAVVDLVTLTVSDDFNTPRNVLVNGGNARVTSTFTSLYGYYRVAEEANFGVDLGIGMRAYWVDTRTRFNPGLAAGGTISTSNSWVDPLITARANYRFSPDWGISVAADIGGFGAGSNFTWQALATIDWRPASWVDLRAGWRYMAIDFTRGDRTLDIAFSGPIIGATFRF